MRYLLLLPIFVAGLVLGLALAREFPSYPMRVSRLPY
jgi:hypothetical protein